MGKGKWNNFWDDDEGKKDEEGGKDEAEKADEDRKDNNNEGRKERE